MRSAGQGMLMLAKRMCWGETLVISTLQSPWISRAAGLENTVRQVPDPYGLFHCDTQVTWIAGVCKNHVHPHLYFWSIIWQCLAHSYYHSWLLLQPYWHFTFIFTIQVYFTVIFSMWKLSCPTSQWVFPFHLLCLYVCHFMLLLWSISWILFFSCSSCLSLPCISLCF